MPEPRGLGTLGLWTRDMKYKANLQQTQINKILKVLEKRKLIKSVKSIEVRERDESLVSNLTVHRDEIGRSTCYTM